MADYIQHDDFFSDNIKSAFFTRNGGVSKGIYSSLNVGYGSDDDAGNVTENRRLLLQSIGNKEENLFTLNQIHSNKVLVVDEYFDRNIEADALVTNLPNRVLGIMTADCVPLLFADEKNKIIGAAHSGWPGAKGGVIQNTIAGMLKLGGDIKNIKCAMGPCIHQDSYEVDPKFYDNFIDDDIENAAFFMEYGKKFMFDLPAYVTNILQKSGVSQIAPSLYDTKSNPDLFFSYRRKTLLGEVDYGRQLSVISMG
jgi:YfiH family protein